jgi:DNA (cytosine-5)-methyltransferase 1
MNYLSVCSGIEAASVAWGPLGWTPWAFAEVDKFPSAVLAHHYPNVPNLGDMTKFQEWPDADVDVLVGGTPCQSFSVAGLRAGLDDPRGGLLLTYLAIARRYRPRWVVWENVPGVLSSDGGRAFGSLLGGLAELGYGFAYRVLDARHFGLAQRRQRVFVVGCLGDWRRAAAVLFERASLSGHPAPRREAGQRLADSLTVGANQCSGTRSDFVEVAPTIPSRRTGGGGLGTDFDCDGGLIPDIANPLTARMANGVNTTCDEGQTMGAHSLRADGFDASEDGTGRGCPIVPVAHAFDARQSDVIQYGDQTGPLDTDGHTIGVLAFSAKDYGADVGDLAPTLRAGGHTTSRANGGVMPAVAFKPRYYTRDNKTGGQPSDVSVLKADASKAGDSAPHVAHGMAVRRLTPRECERLQGFPDDYTAIPYRGKPAADGPRYKALGNSMAVPVMAWIGQRIAQVDAL